MEIREKCNWLLSDEEIETISNNEVDTLMDVTSPAWSNALKVGLNLLPVGMVFIG